MAERKQREQQGPGPVPEGERSSSSSSSSSSSAVDESGGQRERLEGDELARSVSDQELGPHQHKATPAPGTYEEPRPQTEPSYQDAGQRLAERANDDLDELEQREARR